MRQRIKRLWTPFLLITVSLVVIASFLWSFLSPVEVGKLEKPFSFQQITRKDGLSSDMVDAIAIQGEDVWFGTYGGGATLNDRAKGVWRAYTTKGEPPAKNDDGDTLKWKNLLSYNHVTAILLDTDRIWFGTYFYGYGGGGISYYRPDKLPHWQRIDTNRGRAKKIASMAVDGKWLWVGSEKGLSLLDKQTEEWTAFYSTFNGLSGNFVHTILVQPHFLWVGTNGGISRYDKARNVWKTYGQEDGLTETEIMALANVQGRLWAGGIGGALFEYNPASDRWRAIESTDALRGGEIHSLVATKKRVFVCRDNGISVYDFSTGHWRSLTVSDGLLSNTVFCAAEDKNGIWFGTDKGASRLILKR
jgi:ligand-binding sensor domain-containing protein